MVILHISSFVNNPSSGVSVVVPKHVIAQQKLENVALLNVRNYKVNGINNQFEYKTPFSISSLPEPFSKPDLAVFHSIYIPAYIQISNELTKAKIPYVIAPHGSLTKEAQRKKWWKKLPANKLAFKKFFSNAAGYQYLSERERATSNAFKGESFIGTNGIDIPDNKKASFSKNGLKFLYVGRLETKIKGLDLLIEAISKEKDFLLKNNCTFSICGPDFDNERQNLLAMIKQNHLERLVFLNDGVFGKEKEENLLNADIFIQTSRTEAMPMGIIEALSYGVPCLVTKGTSLDEIIYESNAGWHSETDVASISKKIVQAVSEKNHLMQKSQNARQLIESNFDWKKIAEKTIEKYKKMIR